MRFKIIKNNEITSYWFNKMVELEHQTWPEDDPCFLPAAYLKSVFQNTDAISFYAINEKDSELAGYLTLIFLDENNFNQYRLNNDFTILKNIGIKKDNNIAYLYTANLAKKYRGTSCMKQIGIEFVRWYDAQEKAGYIIDKVYAKAVSKDGVRTIVKGFNLEATEDVKSDGLGHYHSLDGMKKYREKMRKLSLK